MLISRAANIKLFSFTLFLILLTGIISGISSPGVMHYDAKWSGNYENYSHIFELVSFGFICAFVLLHDKSTSIKYSKISLFLLFYYIYAVVSSILSTEPLYTLYYAIKGLLYTALGIVLFKEVLNGGLYWVNSLFSLAFVIFISGDIKNFIVVRNIDIVQLNANAVYNSGDAGLAGYISLLLLYFTTYSDRFKKVACALIFVVLIVFSSISSLLSALMATIFYDYHYLKKRLLKFFAIFFVLCTTFLLIMYINLDESSEAYIKYFTGSGRFDVIMASLRVLIENKLPTFGYGFMRDKDFLVLVSDNIPWRHDVHNSILFNLVSFGIIGFILYAIFLVLLIDGFAAIPNVETSGIYYFIVIAALFYGMTSSVFIGSPTNLLAIIVFLSEKIHHEKTKNLVVNKI